VISPSRTARAAARDAPASSTIIFFSIATVTPCPRAVQVLTRPGQETAGHGILAGLLRNYRRRGVASDMPAGKAAVLALTRNRVILDASPTA
jgi:hypothetical protein